VQQSDFTGSLKRMLMRTSTGKSINFALLLHWLIRFVLSISNPNDIIMQTKNSITSFE
jgi:hypothetical protein